jgi:hypothetical protein
MRCLILACVLQPMETLPYILCPYNKRINKVVYGEQDRTMNIHLHFHVDGEDTAKNIVVSCAVLFQLSP